LTVDPLNKGAPKAGDSHGNHENQENHRSNILFIFIIFNLLVI